MKGLRLLLVVLMAWCPHLSQAGLSNFLYGDIPLTPGINCCPQPTLNSSNGLRAVCTGPEEPCGCFSLTYECGSGYVAEGRKTNVCFFGRWHSPHATCVEENACNGPISPCHDNADCTVTPSGYNCTCKTGYFGDGKRTCERGCRPPVVPVGMRVSPPPPADGYYRYLAEVTYTCEPGYVWAMDSAWCLDGFFINPIIACRRGDCEAPPRIDNGRVTTRHAWTVGQVATYSCHPSYILWGTKVSLCQRDGTYSEPPPRCLQRCPEPVTPMNGFVVFAGSVWKEGDTALMSCESGFTMNGNPTSTCTEDSWVPPFDVACTNTTSTVNSSVTDTEPARATSSVPDSQNRCLSVPSPCHYSADCTPTTHNDYKCTCKAGWFGDGYRYCIPGCLPPIVGSGVQVSPPPSRDGYYRQYSTVTYSCKHGYVPRSGPKTDTCISGGFFGDSLNCLRRDCPIPPDISNGRLLYLGLGFVARQFSYYGCDPGYEMVGSPEIWCHDNGTHYPPPPTCLAQCEDPVAPKNGRVVDPGAGWKHGDLVTMTCYDGFTMTGDANSTCTEGDWVPPFNITCTPLEPDYVH